MTTILQNILLHWHLKWTLLYRHAALDPLWTGLGHSFGKSSVFPKHSDTPSGCDTNSGGCFCSILVSTAGPGRREGCVYRLVGLCGCALQQPYCSAVKVNVLFDQCEKHWLFSSNSSVLLSKSSKSREPWTKDDDFESSVRDTLISTHYCVFSAFGCFS